MKLYKFCRSNILILLVVFLFALAFAPPDVFPQNRPRSCAGTNPTVKEAKVEVTKNGGIDLQPCDGQPVTLRGQLLNGSGTVTQVAWSLPNIFNTTGSPINSVGTLTATLANQSGNLFFAAPNGVAGIPGFRGIVSADIPALDAAKTTTGVFDLARIPGLPVSKITSGSFADSFIPALDATKITTGVFNPARLGSGTADNTTVLRGDGTWAAPSAAITRNVINVNTQNLSLLNTDSAKSIGCILSNLNLPSAPPLGTYYLIHTYANNPGCTIKIPSGNYLSDNSDFHIFASNTTFNLNGASVTLEYSDNQIWTVKTKTGTTNFTN